jgi:hypothetical protein
MYNSHMSGATGATELARSAFTVATTAANDAALFYAYIEVCFKAWDDGVER